MNTRSIGKTLLIVLLLSLTLTACGGANQIKDDELTAVTTYSAPAAQHIIDGMANRDYETFTADFGPEMLASMTPDKFTALVNDLDGKLGKYVSHEVSGAEEVEGGYVAVHYKTKFEKATVTMRVVHDAAEPHMVTGLWFR